MLIFLLLTVFQVSAEEPQGWLIGNTEIMFVSSSDRGLINPSCLTGKKCLAVEALKNKVPMTTIGAGGKNPASAICKEIQKGQVMVASRGNISQGFCRFPDGSYASLDGLIK